MSFYSPYYTLHMPRKKPAVLSWHKRSHYSKWNTIWLSFCPLPSLVAAPQRREGGHSFDVSQGALIPTSCCFLLFLLKFSSWTMTISHILLLLLHPTGPGILKSKHMATNFLCRVRQACKELKVVKARGYLARKNLFFYAAALVHVRR
jgi:hypothetical protein